MSRLKLTAMSPSPVLDLRLSSLPRSSSPISDANKPPPKRRRFTVNTKRVTTKPFFSLSTTRTFGTNENPRLWLDHRGSTVSTFASIASTIRERFFTQLSDPHQMGEDEQEQLATSFTQASLLERVRAVKSGPIWHSEIIFASS